MDHGREHQSIRRLELRPRQFYTTGLGAVGSFDVVIVGGGINSLVKRFGFVAASLACWLKTPATASFNKKAEG
jgi:hypothetical protein